MKSDIRSRAHAHLLMILIWWTALLTFGSGTAFGQTWHWDPAPEIFTGAVLVDSSLGHNGYYLDETGNGEPDYLLAFGPWWYRPDSGAIRPEHGETVTVVASMSTTGSMLALVVFELDGMVWRRISEVGMHGWNGVPFWYASDDTLTVKGIALIDSTHLVPHYYLDVDNDSIPDYQLGLGPHWYLSRSGARRPESGDSIVVFGAKTATGRVDHLLVYTIDGLEWRPSDGPAPWGGTWMFADHKDSTLIRCINDSTSWVAFQPGFTGGPNHMGGTHWPDSMFVQFWRIPADSLPGGQDGRRIAGYRLDVFDPGGTSMMHGRFGSGDGMMSFGKRHRIRLHLDESWGGVGHGPNDIEVWTWHEQDGWMLVESSDVNISEDVAEITSDELGSFYALSASTTATGRSPNEIAGVPSTVPLRQNYPNPFNQITTIALDLRESQHVVLEVFDLLGRKVSTLIDETLPTGTTRVVFRPVSGASGVYIYRATIGGRTYSRRMLVLE